MFSTRRYLLISGSPVRALVRPPNQCLSQRTRFSGRIFKRLFLANADQPTPRCRNVALRGLTPRRALSMMDWSETSRFSAIWKVACARLDQAKSIGGRQGRSLLGVGRAHIQGRISWPDNVTRAFEEEPAMCACSKGWRRAFFCTLIRAHMSKMRACRG